MKDMAKQVHRTADEQSRGTRLIVETIENVRTATDKMATSVNEQTAGCARVVSATWEAFKRAKDTHEATGRLESAVDGRARERRQGRRAGRRAAVAARASARRRARHFSSCAALPFARILRRVISWLLLGFAMGLRHSLEADHLAAVASLSARAASPRDLCAWPARGASGMRSRCSP